MKIGTILITTVAALSLLVAGCGAPEPVQAKGTLQVLVTDAPPREEVTSIMVTVESVAVHKAAAGQGQGQSTANTTQSTENVTSSENTTTSQDEETGWQPLDILDGQQTFDLLKIKGIEEVLAVTELEAGKYTQIRMTISSVQVKLGNGALQDATLPSGKLKFTHPFDIVAGETTALLFDFDAGKSVNVTGSDNIIVKPVVKLSVAKPKAIETGKASLKITTPSLPNGTDNVTYNATITAKGGTAPYTWSIDSGTLPAGLNLSSANGTVSGTPTVSGESTFTVKVSDNSTPVKSDTRQYEVTIAP